MTVTGKWTEGGHAGTNEMNDRPRLIEVAFPLKQASLDSVHEKNVGHGDIELTENEWVQACNHRDRYWLYVVFGCATAGPRLLRVQDPFGKLIVRAKGSVIVSREAIFEAAETA